MKILRPVLTEPRLICRIRRNDDRLNWMDEQMDGTRSGYVCTYIGSCVLVRPGAQLGRMQQQWGDGWMDDH